MVRPAAEGGKSGKLDRAPCSFCDVRVEDASTGETLYPILAQPIPANLEKSNGNLSRHKVSLPGTVIAFALRYLERRSIMHHAMVWAAWYLLLLAVPFCIIGSIIREALADRRSERRAAALKLHAPPRS